MLLNSNILLSSLQNMFFDNISLHGYNDGIVIDLHPLHGYKDSSPKYFWSYKSIIVNPVFVYLVDSICFNNETPPQPSNHNHFTLDFKQPISYFVIIRTLDMNKPNVDIAQIQNDIQTIRNNYPVHTINIYLPTLNNDTFITLRKVLEEKVSVLNCDLYTNFDMVHVLTNNTWFVCSNIYSSLFVLCYHFNKVVVVLSDNSINRHHLKRYFTNINFNNLDYTAKEISTFVDHILPYFETNQTKHLKIHKNPFLIHLLKQQPNNISNIKNDTKNVYIHENLNQEYMNILQGIQQSQHYTHTLDIRNAYIIIVSCDESLFMKDVLKRKTNNILIFIDTNSSCIESKKPYFRFNIIHNRFPMNVCYIQALEEMDFFFSNELVHDDNGYILVLLDNYNGIHYNGRYHWISKWTHIIDYLKDTPNEKYKFKLHPNNKEAKNILIDAFGIDPTLFITEDVSLKSLFDKQDIQYCIQRTGSSYVKCYQYGIIILSMTDTVDHDLGIYNVHFYNTNKSYILNVYDEKRFSLLQKYLSNNLVKKDDLINGNFFTYLRSIL